MKRRLSGDSPDPEDAATSPFLSERKEKKPRVSEPRLKLAVGDDAAAVPGEDDVLLTCSVITANIGSAGEDKTGEVLRLWAKDVQRIAAGVDVVSLHLQEIGGKAYSDGWCEAMEAVLGAAFADRAWVSGVLWDDCDRGRRTNDFTAVGAYVALSQRAVEGRRVQWLNRSTGEYECVDQLGGAADDADADAGDAGPQRPAAQRPRMAAGHFFNKKFHDAGGARKGWLAYGLLIDGVATDLVALHLYHDDDNTVTMASGEQEGGGQYAQRRQGALAELMAYLSLHRGVAPTRANLILAGDFNFRLDGRGFVESVKRLASPEAGDSVSVSVSRKHFGWGPAQGEVERVYRAQYESFLPLCRESGRTLEAVAGDASHAITLAELPVTWPPSYPLTPGASQAYSQKRLPAWCDRVLYSPSGSLRSLRYSSEETSLDHNMVLLDFAVDPHGDRSNAAAAAAEADGAAVAAAPASASSSSSSTTAEPSPHAGVGGGKKAPPAVPEEPTRG